MNEKVLSSSEDQVSVLDSTAAISAGAMIRKVRETEGMPIESLAVLLKVPVNKLEALESDRFDLLVDTVFVRALAASVCRTLKVNPELILERLPHTSAPSLKTDESGINTPFRSAGSGLNFVFLDQFTKPLVLAVLVLLIGVFVIIFFPFSQLSDVSGISKSSTVELTPSIAQPSVMSTENSLNSSGQLPVPSFATPSSGVESPLAMGSTAILSSASLSDSAIAVHPMMSQDSGMSTTGLLVLKARASSWVEVVDASGVVQLRKTISDGDAVAASGVLPLSVVVGRADTTEVQVRGKVLDLTTIAKNNIARFEVK